MLTALTVPRVTFCAKTARVCAGLAAFDAKTPTVAVMGNCDRRNGIVIAHIARAANTADEIAASYATPRTFYMGSHRCHLYVQPGGTQRASRPLHARYAPIRVND